MNANDVIEAYVSDVTGRLPRSQRDDVALELSALLQEELAGRARDAGRAADAEMALTLVRTFGRPADVAARYRTPLTIIDPADGHRFVRISAIGLVVIWVAGLLSVFPAPPASFSDLLTRLGHWWGENLIPSLWWPGVLVVWFGLAARSRRRSPRAAEWSPPAQQRARVNRGALAWALIGAAIGIAILIEPRWVLDVTLGGRAAPAAYEALTYTDSFRQKQGPWLLALLILQLPLLAAAVSSGRRPSVMQRVESELSLVTIGVLVWTLLSGPVMSAPQSDVMARGGLVATGLMLLIDLGVRTSASLRRRSAPSVTSG